jgi:hypothetical protein
VQSVRTPDKTIRIFKSTLNISCAFLAFDLHCLYRVHLAAPASGTNDPAGSSFTARHRVVDFV